MFNCVSVRECSPHYCVVSVMFNWMDIWKKTVENVPDIVEKTKNEAETILKNYEKRFT